MQQETHAPDDKTQCTSLLPCFLCRPFPHLTALRIQALTRACTFKPVVHGYVVAAPRVLVRPGGRAARARD